MLLLSLTFSLVSYYFCASESLVCMICSGVFASTVTLFPISLIDFLYEIKRKKQDFISSYKTFLKYFYLLENYDSADYIRNTSILLRPIQELGLISKNKSVIAQQIYNILIDNASKLSKSVDFKNDFKTIEENELNQLIDKIA